MIVALLLASQVMLLVVIVHLTHRNDKLVAENTALDQEVRLLRLACSARWVDRKAQSQ